MEIVNAFPTEVGIFEFEDCEYLNQGLVEFLYDIRDKEKSLGRSMTGYNGYHTPDDLLKRDNHFIKEFYKKITEVLFEYIPNPLITSPISLNMKCSVMEVSGSIILSVEL